MAAGEQGSTPRPTRELLQSTPNSQSPPNFNAPFGGGWWRGVHCATVCFRSSWSSNNPTKVHQLGSELLPTKLNRTNSSKLPARTFQVLGLPHPLRWFHLPQRSQEGLCALFDLTLNLSFCVGFVIIPGDRIIGSMQVCGNTWNTWQMS